jgi:hypothetical protein
MSLGDLSMSFTIGPASGAQLFIHVSKQIVVRPSAPPLCAFDATKSAAPPDQLIFLAAGELGG